MRRVSATAFACLLVGSSSSLVGQRQARVCNPDVACRTIDTSYIGDRRYEDYRVTNRNVMVNVPQRRAILNTSPADAAAACSLNPYAGIQSTLPSLTYTSASVSINASGTNQIANLSLQNVRTSDGYSVPTLNLLINRSTGAADFVFLTFFQSSNPGLGFPGPDLSWNYRLAEPLLPAPSLAGAQIVAIPQLSGLQVSVQRLLLAAAAALPTLYFGAGSIDIGGSSGLPVWTHAQVIQIATQLSSLIFSYPGHHLPPLRTLTCEVSGRPYASCQERQEALQFGSFLTFYGSSYLLSGNTFPAIGNSLLSNLRNWAAANALRTYPGYDPANPSHQDILIKYTLNTSVSLPLAVTWSMLRNDPVVSGSDRALIDGWVGALLAYAGRPYNNDLEVSPSNHGYLLEGVSMARAILFGDDARFAQAVERYYIALHQMNPDGSLPYEVTRDGCATAYQALAVMNLIALAELAASQGYDLYSLSVNGVSIHTAVKFLLDAVENPALISQYAYSQPAGQAVCWLPPRSPQDLQNVVYPLSAAVGRHMHVAFIDMYAARFPNSPLSVRLRGLPQGGIAAVRPLSKPEAGGNATCLAMTDPFVKITLSGPSETAHPAEGGAGTLALTSSSPSFAWIAEASAPWLTLVSASGVGNGTIRYTVSPNPAPSQRQASITAGNQVFLVTQSGTRPVPVIAPGGIVNAASFSGSPVAAGSLATLFGSNLASSAPADTVLRLNGILAPLFAVLPGQINFQVPWELAGQPRATVTATVGGITSRPHTLELAATGPGIFTTSSSSGGQGAILLANTDVIAAPAGSIPGRACQPARRGGVITIFATGLGPVNNQPATGAPAPSSPLSQTSRVPSVTIGGVSAPVSFSGLAPGFLGLYQVNATLPAGAPTGSAVAVSLSIGGATSNTVTIAVE